MVSSPQRSDIKNLVAFQHTQYITGRYICQPSVTLAADFFCPSPPWCVGIRNGVEGGEAPPSKTTTEDDVIRCQLPPPCGIFMFSLFLMTHTKRCNLWDKGVKRPSVPNHPAKRLGVKRALALFYFRRIFGNVQDYSQ